MPAAATVLRSGAFPVQDRFISLNYSQGVLTKEG